MIDFTPITQEVFILLVWTKILSAADFIPQSKQKKGLPKENEKFKHYVLYITRGILILIQGGVAHAGSFFEQTGQKRKLSSFALLLLPQQNH